MVYAGTTEAGSLGLVPPSMGAFTYDLVLRLLFKSEKAEEDMMMVWTQDVIGVWTLSKFVLKCISAITGNR